MVTGIPALKRRLEKHAITLKSAVGGAMAAGGEQIASTARLLVPKDTGELASTIKSHGVEPTKRGNQIVIVSAGDESTRVGSRNQFQLALIIEYGTTRRPAEPFMAPALRLNRKTIQANIRKAMRAAIRSA